MRLLTSALCGAVTIGLLAGCAGTNMSSSGTALPSVMQQQIIDVDGNVAPPHVLTVLHSLVPEKPDLKKKPLTGVYITQFYGSTILGYPPADKSNHKPVCAVQNVSYANDVAVDGKGRMMDPDGGSGYLIIHKGPNMCGTVLTEIADTYGQPSDATSADAMNGNILVGNIKDKSSGNGSISICTVKGGCTVNLTNANMYEAGGVAMSNTGDCWVDAKPTSSGGAALIYYKGCTGKGEVAKGFKSTYYGGMDIDNKGNLVVIDEMALAVYIYSGCNPTCKVIGGPFSLQAESFFGKLNGTNTNYQAVDRTDGVVDVYSYSETKGITYEYQYSAGLTASSKPEGIAQDRRSKQ